MAQLLNTKINNKLVISDTSVTTDHNLYVKGSTNLTGLLNVGTILTVGSSITNNNILTVNGKSTFKNDVSIYGSNTVNSYALIVNGKTNLKNNLIVEAGKTFQIGTDNAPQVKFFNNNGKGDGIITGTFTANKIVAETDGTITIGERGSNTETLYINGSGKVENSFNAGSLTISGRSDLKGETVIGENTEGKNANLIVNGNLETIGTSKLIGNVGIGTDPSTDENEKLNIVGTVKISEGDLNTIGNVSITGTNDEGTNALTVKGKTKLTGDLNTIGNVSITGTENTNALKVTSGNTSLKKTIIGDETNTDEILVVNGNETIKGNLDTSGRITAGARGINEDKLYIEGNGTVENSFSAGSLNISGESNLKGDTVIGEDAEGKNANLTVNGNTNLTGNLTVSGAIDSNNSDATFNTLTVNNTASLKGETTHTAPIIYKDTDNTSKAEFKLKNNIPVIEADNFILKTFDNGNSNTFIEYHKSTGPDYANQGFKLLNNNDGPSFRLWGSFEVNNNGRISTISKDFYSLDKNNLEILTNSSISLTSKNCYITSSKIFINTENAIENGDITIPIYGIDNMTTNKYENILTLYKEKDTNTENKYYKLIFNNATLSQLKRTETEELRTEIIETRNESLEIKNSNNEKYLEIYPEYVYERINNINYLTSSSYKMTHINNKSDDYNIYILKGNPFLKIVYSTDNGITKNDFEYKEIKNGNEIFKYKFNSSYTAPNGTGGEIIYTITFPDVIVDLSIETTYSKTYYKTGGAPLEKFLYYSNERK